MPMLRYTLTSKQRNFDLWQAIKKPAGQSWLAGFLPLERLI